MRVMNILKLPFAAALLVCAFSAGSFEAQAAGKGLQRGAASWYGPGFHGRKTANGERFDQNAMTAAHRSLPFGTKVRIVNERTGRSVVVRINDRGPFHGGRIIDLAKAPALALGITGTGLVSLHRDG
jgi:rare lipoprotein A